jgi:hypothetical protein
MLHEHFGHGCYELIVDPIGMFQDVYNINPNVYGHHQTHLVKANGQLGMKRRKKDFFTTLC